MNYINNYYARLKKWHEREVELGPTERDERNAPKVTPLTDEQKEMLQSENYAMRLAAEENARLERSWRERRYADSCDKDERLW